MECHTCQNLYHQECHEPVITDQEVADPRLIWNCSKCVKPIAQSVRMYNIIKIANDFVFVDCLVCEHG